MKKAIELDPNIPNARASVLEKKVADKQEKLKSEMLGKLKSVGDSILGRFGMSTDDFKMVQDPATGSYSINFSPTK